METTRRREFCRSNELVGETVHEVLSASQVPEIAHLDPYKAYALRMRSGKLFCITTCMSEVQFSRITPDMEPVIDAPRDPKREAQWVVRLGRCKGKDVFIFNPSHNTRTTDLDAAFGWRTRKDAQRELDVWFGHSTSSFGLDEGTRPSLARRRGFR